MRLPLLWLRREFPQLKLRRAYITRARVRELAIEVFKRSGCAGLAREPRHEPGVLRRVALYDLPFAIHRFHNSDLRFAIHDSRRLRRIYHLRFTIHDLRSNGS